VRRATNWALDENLNKSNLKDVPKDFHPTIERRHFNLVLEKDMKAAFGAADEALQTYHREGIFHYGPKFEQAVQELHAAAQLSEAVPKSTILLTGARSDTPFLSSVTALSCLLQFVRPSAAARCGCTVVCLARRSPVVHTTRQQCRYMSSLCA
jgi:hypothetical protein